MAKKHKVGDRVLTTVRKWEVGKSKNKGTKFVRVQLEGFISWTGYITPKTTAKTMEALETMGFRGTSLSQLGAQGALDTETEIVAVIGEIREWEGKTYYNADWINQNAAFGFNEESKDLLDEFDIDTRAYISDTKDISPPASTEYAQQAPAETHNFTADDIPF